MYNRNRTARLLARTSPTVLFTYASESMTRTGEWRETAFRRSLEDYSDRYDRYVLKKVGVLRQFLSAYEVEIEFKGDKVLIETPVPEQYQGDMSDFPRFEQPKFPLSEGMNSALGDIAGLVIWNLFAALGAFAAIRRMEVRQ